MEFSYEELIKMHKETEERLLHELKICREIIKMIETYAKMYPKGIDTK